MSTARLSPVHIAGVGIAGIDPSDGHRLDQLSISAATKALLDAGITYNDVDQSIGSFLDFSNKIPRATFDALGMRGTPVAEVDNTAALSTAYSSVRSGQSHCTLLVGLDREQPSAKGLLGGGKVLAVGIVLVSQLFLTSRAFLKDAAVVVRSSVQVNRVHSRSSGRVNEAHTSKTAVDTALRMAGVKTEDIQVVEVRASSNPTAKQALFDLRGSGPQGAILSLGGFVGVSGLVGLVGLVWNLRGWGDQAVTKTKNVLQYTSTEDGTATVLILGRSDGHPVPEWGTIQNLRDGRERLGYNPAVTTRAISKEDLEDVRAKEEFTSDDAIQRLHLYIKGGDKAALARL